MSLGNRLQEEVALLDRRADPDGATFSRLVAPMLRPRYVTSAAHSEVRQVSTEVRQVSTEVRQVSTEVRQVSTEVRPRRVSAGPAARG